MKDNIAAQSFTMALAGNPNSGKSTLFNALTGARQKVGNYPGVTVERHEGFISGPDGEACVIDLPGAYSLTPFSQEEEAARDALLSGGADAVINVVDASNLERNLYLTLQLLELGAPTAVALNMSDIAAGRGFVIDTGKLEKALGVPVAFTVGHTGAGVKTLPELARRAAAGARYAPPVDYGPELEKEISVLAGELEERPPRLSGRALPARWAAIKLLEDDKGISALLSPEAAALAAAGRARAAAALGESPETAIASRRYAVITEICRLAARSSAVEGPTISDRIDAVVLNRALGIPLFLGLMYLVFQLTFTLGTPPMEWLEAAFSALGSAVSGLWPAGSESSLRALLVDGVIGGVGGVLVFLPNILLLFLAIGLLEDSGYMARAAFIMDRLMSRMGLHGKSFIPMLIGFGCSVPAIMATRTLENRRDRLVTMLVTPLMSCGARLPIYALLIPAFFPPAWQAPVLWGVYLTGILLAVLTARLLRSTLLAGERVPFVMELPPYHRPTLRGVLGQMLGRSWLYVRKAGTVILPISLLLWFLSAYPRRAEFSPEYAAAAARAAALAAGEQKEALSAEAGALRRSEELSYTYSGRLGRAMEPVLAPLGFDWKIGTAMVGAFAAKEVFVAQMGIVYAAEAEGEGVTSLGKRIRAIYSPLTALCIMLFALISAPCMATIAVTRKESGSWGWALLQLGGLTALAWTVTFAVYQGGRLAGFGG